MWFDTNEDGQLNGNETLITALDDTDADGYFKITDPLFTDFATGDYTVRFVDAITPKALDLTGFGAGDKLIIDGKANAASWYGLEATLLGWANSGPAPGLTDVPTITPSGTDFGIYPVNKSAGGYIYWTGTPTAVSAWIYAYISQKSSKVFGKAELYSSAAIFKSAPSNPLAKGLPTAGTIWPGYALEVIKPSSVVVIA
jgi:hypothetical protein